MKTYRRIVRRRLEAALRLTMAPGHPRHAVEPVMDPFDELATIPVSLSSRRERE